MYITIYIALVGERETREYSLASEKKIIKNKIFIIVKKVIFGV